MVQLHQGPFIFFTPIDKYFFENKKPYGHRMKKYTLVTPDGMIKLGKCFSDIQEMDVFVSQMDNLMMENLSNLQARSRLQGDAEVVLMIKQVCGFILFCREHMELIQQLVANLQCTEITEQQMKELEGK